MSDTIACIQSLIKSAEHSECSLVVLVVDNSGDFPDQYDGPVTVLKTGFNVGLAGAWYIAQYHHIAQASDYLIFLNNDTQADLAFFDGISKGVQKWGGQCAFGPRIHFSSDPQKIWSRGGRIKRFSASVVHAGEGVPVSKVETGDFETGHLSGCCMIINTESMNDIGGADTNFFFRGEEWDINYRLAQRGVKLVILDEVRLFHHVNGSHDRFDLKMLYLAYRSKMLFAKKIQPFWYFPVWLGLSYFYIIFVAANKFAKLSGRDALDIKPVLLKAFKDGLARDKIRIEDYER
ncbi:glycosyltransferase family 2 protein [Aquabacterium sp. NJ1]|uniref:glycosyltransferase family 2 protein n=1 Tax=Aquabacterium sp. NJ1 TaxID=1538295 RepID=UPI00126A16B6|nr:glycosyltransferase family 2 protein [Aquabacterium sp. NJ1]